jgi:hypothetical protein
MRVCVHVRKRSEEMGGGNGATPLGEGVGG